MQAFISTVVYFYIGVMFANAIAPSLATALANSGLDEPLRRLIEIIFSLLP